MCVSIEKRHVPLLPRVPVEISISHFLGCLLLCQLKLLTQIVSKDQQLLLLISLAHKLDADGRTIVEVGVI